MLHAHGTEHAERLCHISPGFISPIPPAQQTRVRQVASGQLRPTAELLLDTNRVEYPALCALDVGRCQAAQRCGQRPVGESVG